MAYKINDSFFESIDTQEKAYFLGLMASDGCVTEGNRVIISLQERDSYILDLMKQRLEYEGVIYFIKARTENHQNIRRLQFRNKKISEDLNKLGIFPRKSLKLQFPNLPEQFHNDFIRGYFDGDGCMRISKGVLNYKFVGTYEFLKVLQDILIKNCNVKETKLYQAKKNKNTWELSYGGDRQCIRIYGFMYKNATVFLERKRDKVRKEIQESLSHYPSYVLQEELRIRD